MLVKVKTLTGSDVRIYVEPDDNIMRVKELIEEAEGIPPEQQRLIFAGKQLIDEKKVEDYKITPGSVLHLVLALRGGHKYHSVFLK